jgi:tetratricopeptide (TPR) repeat protein
MARPSLRNALTAALILLATFAAYSPVLAPDTRFVWDDDNELWGTRGHLVQDSDGILQAWFPLQRPEQAERAAGAEPGIWEWEPVPGHGFWPLTPSVLWLEWRLFGADDRWAMGHDTAERIAAVEQIANLFHIPNILLHALNAILIWIALARLAIPGSRWIGLVFALHPICVPSVAWVSELKNTLSLAMMLSALHAYLSYDERPRRWLHATSLLLFFLSLTAKTSGVGFPFLLLGAIWWRRGAVSLRDGLRVLPFFVLSLLLGWTTLWFTQQSGGINELVRAPASLPEALAGAGWISLFYAWKTFLPLDLMMIYPRLDPSSWGAARFLPSLVLVVLLGASWLKREQWGRGPCFALFAAGVLLFPVLGFFEMTYMMHSEVSDHFHYASLVPPLALAIGGFASWTASRPRFRPALPILGIGLALTLGVMTFERAKVFKSHLALWSDNVERNPEAWMAQYNLGSSLLIEADHMRPSDARIGVSAWAAQHLARATELQPTYARAHYRLGRAFAETGEDERAIEAWRTALELEQAERALESKEEAIRRTQIARAARRLRRFEEARSEFERSLELWPGQPELHFELGRVVLRLGDELRALGEFERVLEANNDHFKAHVSLAMLLATAHNPSIRDGKAALNQALEARRVAPASKRSQLRVLHALAAAHAERGSSRVVLPEQEFKAATRLMREAMELSIELGDLREMQIAASRYKIYASGQGLRRSSTRR